MNVLTSDEVREHAYRQAYIANLKRIQAMSAKQVRAEANKATAAYMSHSTPRRIWHDRRHKWTQRSNDSDN